MLLSDIGLPGHSELELMREIKRLYDMPAPIKSFFGQ